MEQLTRATGTGFAIAWSKDNWNAWERSLPGASPASKVEGFNKMIGFLAANFPGSVRTVRREN